MGVLVNRARMTVSGAPGTGAVTLGGAVTGFQSFSAAGVTNGQVVSYVIEDVGGAWECGQGTYTTAGTTLTRTTIQGSSNNGSAISATAAATVYISALAGDIPQASSTTPAIDGTAAIGTSLTYARADHVHPTDTGRAPMPTSSAGVGQWKNLYAPDSTALVLPAGGTWAYMMCYEATSSGIWGSAITAGVAAGGATIGSATAGYSIFGLGWRIA